MIKRGRGATRPLWRFSSFNTSWDLKGILKTCLMYIKMFIDSYERGRWGSLDSLHIGRLRRQTNVYFLTHIHTYLWTCTYTLIGLGFSSPLWLNVFCLWTQWWWCFIFNAAYVFIIDDCNYIDRTNNYGNHGKDDGRILLYTVTARKWNYNCVCMQSRTHECLSVPNLGLFI